MTLVVTIFLFFVPATSTVDEILYKISCKQNLDQIGKSMKLYVIDFGRSIEYPKDFGAGFLTTLYRENLLLESYTYICSDTSDENKYKDLGTIRGSDKAHENFVSYAGRKNLNQKKYPGILKNGLLKPNKGGHFKTSSKDAAITTISSDDTQAGDMNHASYINFLFLDGHGEKISKNHNWSKKSYYFDPLTN